MKNIFKFGEDVEGEYQHVGYKSNFKKTAIENLKLENARQ
jgi:hypothetical protein